MIYNTICGIHTTIFLNNTYKHSIGKYMEVNASLVVILGVIHKE